MNIFENNIKMDNLFGMYLLDRFPVFCYSDITDTVNVALIGESIIRDDFFKNFASVCHMIGKKLNVTVVSDDAVEFITRFIEKNPMSKDTFLIQHIDKSYQITDFSVSNGKYSYAVKKTGVLLTVIIADCDIQSADDIQKIDDKIYPEKTDTLFKYNWIVGNTVEVNKKYKEILTDYLSKKICVSYKKGISCFIGQLGMGDKELVSQSRTGNISIVHISLDADSSEIDKFGKKLNERAFDIHRFYAKEYNSRKSINEMKKKFRKTYNLTSSMRAVLTIPYKMASVLGGSSAAFSREDIDMFCHTVCEENRNHILERLVCLEHKSWMIWLICDGWKLPMLDEIRKYAFVNGNDFKDRKNKFHPCLIESLEDVPMELEELTEKQWDDI